MVQMIFLFKQVIFRFNMFFQGVPCMEFAPTPGESSRKNVKHDILVMFFFFGGEEDIVFSKIVMQIEQLHPQNLTYSYTPE